jgi:hypothetical protein
MDLQAAFASLAIAVLGHVMGLTESAWAIAHAPPMIWIMAALALVVYSMTLPEHYEIACGAYTFALVVTMGASGEYPMAVLIARRALRHVGEAVGPVPDVMTANPGALWMRPIGSSSRIVPSSRASLARGCSTQPLAVDSANAV